MREQRLRDVRVLPDYKVAAATRRTITVSIRTSRRTATYTGLGHGTSTVHDQWAIESMGAIQDRTREHLGQATRRSCNTAGCCAGDREGRRRREAGALSERRQCPQHPGTRYHGRHRPDARLGIYWMESRLKRRRGAPWAAPVPKEIAAGFII